MTTATVSLCKSIFPNHRPLAMQLCRTALRCSCSTKLHTARLYTVPGSNPRPPGLFGKGIYDEEEGGYPTAKLDVLLRSLTDFNHHGRQTEVSEVG